MGLLTSVILPLFLTALVLSGMYVLISVGFSLVFGVMTVVNLAHGFMVMMGGYLTYVLYQSYGISPFVSILGIVPLMFVFGYALQVIGLERVLEDLETNSLLMTFGLLIAGEAVIRSIFANRPRSINYLGTTVEVFEASTSQGKLVAGAMGFLSAGLFALFLSRAKYGRAIRATAQAPNLAEACGIDSKRVRAITLGLGTMLAGIGGISYVMVYTVSPIRSRQLLIIVFVVTVLGGLGSLKGAAVAGVIVAFVQVYLTYYIGPTETLLVLYTLVVVLLLIMPHGLYGEEREYYAA